MTFSHFSCILDSKKLGGARKRAPFFPLRKLPHSLIQNLQLHLHESELTQVTTPSCKGGWEV